MPEMTVKSRRRHFKKLVGRTLLAAFRAAAWLAVIILCLVQSRTTHWTARAQATGLVAAYGFDEGTGASATDSSGNGNTGTIAGATWATPGMYGGALEFDGATSAVTIADAVSLDLADAMTLEAWVRPSVAPEGWRAIIHKDVDRYYLTAGSDTDRPVVGGTFGTVNQNVAGPAVLPVNTWTHVAATYDKTTIRLYVNGIEVATGAQTAEVSTSDAVLTIGADFYGENFAGLIDEVRIYSRALSTAEIQTDMGTPVTSTGPWLTITQPAPEATVVGTTVNVTYTSTGDQTGVDHVHFQLDANPEVMDVTFDGVYQFTNVPAGPHTLIGHLVRADHSAIPNTDASVSFTSSVPDTTPPTAPSNLVAGASGSQITLGWTAAIDNVGVTGYRVERCQTAGCSNFSEIVTVTSPAYVDAGLAATTSYSYRVRATDAAVLFGPYSNIASATTGGVPPALTGLVAAYAFDETSGTTVTDASGNTNTGTITAATRTLSGKFGSALSFDGTDARVIVPDSTSLALADAMTLEAWVLPSVAPSGWRAIIHKDVDRYYLMAGSDTDHPVVGGTFGTANQNVTGPAVLPVNTWTHLAATYDRTTIRLHVNGIEVASGAQTAAVSTSNAVLTIGADFYGEYFAGLIDEVRIYNRALSTAEIQTDMATPVTPTGPRLNITLPAAGATIAGTTVNVTYTSTGDQTGVNHVHFQLDANSEVMDLTFDGVYQFTNVPAGPHTLIGHLVRADHSAIPNTDASTSFTTTVPDTIRPTVSLSSPGPASTVSGVINMAASASDNVGVAGVQFKLDGNNVGVEDSTSPYSISLNTTVFGNGPHSATAVARDFGGNSTTSTSVAFTISNTNPTDPSLVGQWSDVNTWPIVAVHAALLPTGDVLAWSDYTTNAGAQIWRPATNTFVPKTYDTVNLFCAGHSYLADGRLFIAGGADGAHENGPYDSTIFDPVTESWSPGPFMAARRYYPTTTTLGDGRILVQGGVTTCATCVADLPEIYNPASNTWTSMASSARMAFKYYPHAFVLPDGRVLVTGQDDKAISTRALNLTTQTWTTIDSRILDGHSSAMYMPGKIVKAGRATADNPGQPSAATTYVLDMTQPSPLWQATAPMAFPRSHLNLTILPNGQVLATGGATTTDLANFSAAVYEAEIWSPTPKTWATMARMQTPRMYHSTALLLPDGRVLVAGGGRQAGLTLPDPKDQENAEIFSPPYLFRGPRPVISSAPALISYGATFSVATPDAARIASVSLIALGAVTHAFDENQRFVPLTFQQAGGSLNVQGPINGNTAPPGPYMLFLVDTNGVPSVAAMVRLPAAGGPPPPDTTPPTVSVTSPGAGATLTGSFGIVASASDNVAMAGVQFLLDGANLGPEVTGLGPAYTYTWNTTTATNGPHTLSARARDAAGNTRTATNIAITVSNGETTPPTVSVTSPGAGATLTGSFGVVASASDNVAMAGVQFLLDGAILGPEVTGAGPTYTYTWNTTTATNGSHTLSARARDGANNTATAANVVITVSNAVPSGLVAAYSFNAGSGTTAADSSGSGIPGTLSGAAWTTAGKYGNALSFNGTSSYVNLGNPAALSGTGSMTWAAWVKATGTPPDDGQIISKSSGANGWQFKTSPDTGPHTFAIAVTGSTGSAQRYSSTVRALNTWYHVAAVYNAPARTLDIYVNGVLDNGVLDGTVPALRTVPTTAVNIGRRSGGFYFPGVIDDVRVYNHAVSQAEIQTMMITPLP
jgi:hypothetical protein